MPRRVKFAGTKLLVCIALMLGDSGCVTSKKYRLARDGTPPAVALGWTATGGGVDLTLASVIVVKGPGSWKKEARWDEYVVKIANRAAKPFTLESTELTDLLGNRQIAGDDPWRLEKLSYTNWDKYGKTGLKLLAGAGAVTLYAGAATAASLGSFMAGPRAAAGGTALLDIVPVVAVVDIAAVAVKNHNNKNKVVAEFDRRRLALPLTVAPGATKEGSLFFPMTPGPQRLILKGRAGVTPLELGLELKPLAGLHLKAAPEKRPKPP